MRRQKQYVTQQYLDCVKQNGIYPQEIQNTPNEFATFIPDWLQYTKYTKCKVKVKYMAHWQEFSADEINEFLSGLPWKEENT